MAITRIKNNQITDLTVNAAAKLQDFSITSGKIANNLTYGSDLTITGNLTVQGNVTAIDTIDLVVEDPLIVLAKDQTGSPSLDIGYIGIRGNEDNIAFVWDESEGQFVAVFTTSEITNTTITINSFASLQVLDITAANANITGNLTFNGSILGNVDVTGNVTAGNLVSDAAVDAVTITASGNLVGGNAVVTGDVGAATVTASGNVSGGNLVSAADVTTVTVTATGNVAGGNITTVGNIDGANINASAGITAGTTIVATGNIAGGNVTTVGNVDGANINASAGITAGTTIVATGNVSGGNLTTAGNVDGANINASAAITAGTTITATGNIAGGNISTTGRLLTGILETTGDSLIGGNLVVQGNLTYINIDDLRVEDPIIVLGTGPNGAPLTANDGRDRGIYMEYFDTATANAFMGFQNASGNMIIANDVEFSGNDIVQINSFGNLNVGNLFPQSLNTGIGNVTAGNLNTSGQVVATGNVTGGNVSAGSGIISTTGNIDGANVNATANVTGAGAVFSGNVTAANFIGNIQGNIDAGGANTTIQFNDDDILNGSTAFTFDTSSNAVTATGNVTAGNIDTAGVVVATGNVSGGNITTVGNIDGANVNASGTVTATGNVTGGNFVTTGTADLGNIRVTGNDITNSASNIITLNTAASDIDVRISGDTVANLLVTDAGTDTVLIGTGTPTVGAALKIGTTNSLMVPVGNTFQRPDPAATGMVRFNTTLDALEYFDSTGWESTASDFTIVTADTFNGDGSTVVFVLSEDSTTAATIVAINGVVQQPTTAYAVAGNVLTFTEAPAATDAIDARLLVTTSQVTGIQNTAGNAVVETLAVDTVQITGNLLPASSNTFNLGSTALRWNELFLEGSTITLGNTVIKNTSGNSIGFFGPDGTTAASVDAASVDTTQIANGTSSLAVIESGGNIRANVGSSTVALITSTGANITGAVDISGNVTGGNLGTAGVIVATGNITGGNLITAGLMSLISITKTGSNGVGNIGQSDNSFNTIFAQATSAQYADLAEMYEADAEYEPGTVLCFGGGQEVTVCDSADCTRVAGVVSTNPSYLMNSHQPGEHVAAVALTGRVPTLVSGSVRKGDLMVSTEDGRARANNAAAVGTVIGKALEDFDGALGMIEVVVGRV